MKKKSYAPWQSPLEYKGLTITQKKTSSVSVTILHLVTFLNYAKNSGESKNVKGK